MRFITNLSMGQLLVSLFNRVHSLKKFNVINVSQKNSIQLDCDSYFKELNKISWTSNILVIPKLKTHFSISIKGFFKSEQISQTHISSEKLWK